MVEIVLSVIMRYASDLGYTVFLIWAVETFPTVCRARGVGISLCGLSLGCALAYAFHDYNKTRLSMSVVFGILVVVVSRMVKLDYEHKLTDTLNDNFYDQEDKFKSV